MTFEEIGAYIRLLMLQFNQGGKFSKAYAERMLGVRFSEVWSNIGSKFKEEGGFCWNERLNYEIERRQSYCESRRNVKNRMQTVRKPYAKRIGNGNGNGNRHRKLEEKGGLRGGNIYLEFIEKFNLLTEKSFRGDGKSKAQLNARLKEGWVIEKILQAASNCKKDRYHIENPHFLTPEFITRADKLEKYSNWQEPGAIPEPEKESTYHPPTRKND